MPRLLLVDDNSSIHKIAESLLAHTDIELVCAESAKDALNRVAQGEHFDVALLDTAMPGMDGWELLRQLRMHPATAAMPVAMMAGVLDTVDPSQVDHPSIQGFLKKPVELRDLGTRVHSLLLATVTPPEPPTQEFSPFSTMPAVKISDLGKVHDSESPAEITSDILVLEESDLWPEPLVVAGTRTEDLSPFSEIPPEEHLDLEDFDLDSLKSLTSGAPFSAPIPEPVVIPVVESTAPQIAEPEVLQAAEPEAAPTDSAFDLFGEDSALPLELEEELPASLEIEPSTQELPDLGPETEPTLDPSSFDDLDTLADEAIVAPSAHAQAEETLQADPDLLSGLGEVSSATDMAVIDWTQEAEPKSAETPFTPAFVADHTEALPEIRTESLVDEVPEAVALGVAEAAPVVTPPETSQAPAAVPQAAASEVEVLLQALLANPALMNQLTKAVVTKLSDQALREIAWEVMPELAERLNRH